MSKLYKPCERCNGTGKIKHKQEKLDTPHVKRMLKIMKKYDLNQLKLAKILDISQGTVNGWFYKKTNLQGRIKLLYFTQLKLLGYV